MRGKSGRIVIDLEPVFKRRLYSRLSEDGITLKEWFLARATEYVERDGAQLLGTAAPGLHPPVSERSSKE
jgi:hypothetical protein